ncbi:hypothetical protein PTKIN_Ptkin01aG0032700 [Pterospermum kingtungense]
MSSSSSSSSSVKNSNPKPLNPFASSYQPLSVPPLMAEPQYTQDEIYLLQQVPQPQSGVVSPHPHLMLPHHFYPHPSFVYDSEEQPHSCVEVFKSPKCIPCNGISYGTERITKKKTKSKCGFLPPRSSKALGKYPMQSRRVWVKKADEAQTMLEGKTSIMIKNVPNHFHRVGLQRMLDDHCRSENRRAQPKSNFCKSAYDFLYLPMDFGFGLNLGYAFVNFTSPVAAFRFYKAFNNLEWSFRNRKMKTCKIGLAKVQGKEALKKHFQRSSFPCHTDDYLPVVFSPPRDGFNSSKPILVGRRTQVTATPEDEKVMIMTKRKNKNV